MKTEGAFNRKLAKELKKLSPDVKYVKSSDKYCVGISDFLIWKEGKSAALEVKFIKKWPSQRSRLLSHPFSGAQINFMNEIDATGNVACGLIAVEEEKQMYLVPAFLLPKEGNWNTGVFREMISDFGGLEYADYEGVKFGCAKSLIEKLFL